MSKAVEDAVASSKRAVQFDQLGNYEAASYYYKEAAKYLESAVEYNSGSAECEQWIIRALQYKQRAKALEDICEYDHLFFQNLKETCVILVIFHFSPVKDQDSASAQSESQQILQRCNFLFSQALDADERGHKDIAIELYGQTVEFAINSVSNFSVLNPV